jgi:DNA polymerase III sliding clamp (beta) subunit (PCNA family)
MKKDTITEEKAKNSPAGGVLVGKREGQTIIHDKGTQGGYFVGKLHKEGGIKGINKSTGQPIEVQGGEVIITAPAVADQTKREFEGQMLTNREILSKINEKGGGVSLENGGEIYFNGSSYNYGGKTMTDYEIMQEISNCGCEHEYDNGGEIEKLIKEGQIDLKFYKTTPTHAKEYGIECKNPIYIQTLYITKENRLNGLGKKTLKYLDDYCKKNGNDVIFGHISNKVEFTKDERTSYFSDVELMKYWLHDNGYAINDDNNDFHKVVNVKYNNGGQMNLAEKSKKGDHPSRDLNNYNDVLDMEADGMVGVENGLAFDEGGFMADVYAGGGQTLSAEVFEWDKVPTNYRNISKVKKVPFTNNPMDKGLDSIIAPFLGKDELRQSMMGVNFDENGITATNAFVLITLPYPNEKYNGIYDINKAKKTKSNDLILIDENYAKYQNIIPNYKDAGTPYLVDVYKLLQYTKTAMNYANKTTYAIAFKYGDNQRIGFNGKLLVEVLTTALKLGHEKIYVFIQESKRAIVLSPNKNYELGNDDILLTMPVMLEANGVSYIEKYGTNDPDYNRSLKAYFDFNDSEIHNADGSVAEFKMQYESNLSVDDKYLTLLSKITSKYNKLPICDYAKVEDGKMTATDLNISLIIKDVNMPNGMYEIVNKAPNITMYPIEDFPKERVFDKSEYETHWKEKRQTAFEFVTFSEVFEFYLDKLLLSVGKDDLRPVMSGICIKKTINNELFLVTTNAHTLCKINITDFCDFDKDDRELEYILPTKYLKDFIKLADGSLHFKCNLTNVFIESDNLEYIARAIDGKYPNYEAVIPKQNDKMIVFDHAQMNKCLKSPEVANQVAKYKGNKDVFFTLSNEGNNLFLKVTKEIRFNVEYQLVDKIKLCEIEFNYEQVDTNIGLDKSVFLLMPSKDEFKENQYFSFRKEFFDTMLETITDTEVECYFTEPNRAYIFPIDAIDYKKTLPDEKTKQQKLSKKDLEQISELEDLKDVLEPIADEEPTFEEIIDLGNNFEIKVEKVFYESGDSTYGAMIFYKNELFKYFVTISNTTKKQAIDNVYKYLKTLRVSDKILENAPKKGEFTVFYNDKGGEHRRIEYSKAEIQQFIFDVKSVTKAEIVPAIENKKYVIESKGFREGIGSSSYKQKREKQKDDIKNQIEKIELQEAIETLEMLIETAKGKDKKDIKEALEILKMLNENN